MTVAISLSPRDRAFLARAEGRLGRDEVRKEVLAFFRRRARSAASAVSRSIYSDSGLRRRTGALASSIEGRGELVATGVYAGAPAIRVGVFEGPALRYAGVQEFGTQGANPESPYPTIRPVRAKALTVPIGANLTAAGDARFPTVKDWESARGKLRFVPIHRGRLVGLLVAAPKKKKALRRGKRKGESVPAFGDSLDEQHRDDRTEVAFALLSAVDLQPRAYLERGFRGAIPEIEEGLGELLGRLATGGGGAAGR